MTAWEVALQVLKFAALGVATASGWYGTLHETRTKDGLTSAGKKVFGCLIISSIVAIVSQALETKNTLDKIEEDRIAKVRAELVEDEKRKVADRDRADQFAQLQAILGTAQAAGASSERAAQRSMTAVEQLQTVAGTQHVALEQAWRLQRPFGTWQARTLIWQIVPDESTFMRYWTKDVVEHAKKDGVLDHLDRLEIRRRDPLFPTTERYGYFFGFEDDIAVMFSRVPRQRVRPYRFTDADLEFRLRPENVSLSVHVDKVNWRVDRFDVETTYSVHQEVGSTALSNWVDLYGTELIVFPAGLLSKAETFALSLFYKDTINPKGLTHVWTDKERSESDDGTVKSYSFSALLNERDLGPFPAEYRQLFKEEFARVNQRLTERGIGIALIPTRQPR